MKLRGCCSWLLLAVCCGYLASLVFGQDVVTTTIHPSGDFEDAVNTKVEDYEESSGEQDSDAEWITPVKIQVGGTEEEKQTKEVLPVESEISMTIPPPVFDDKQVEEIRHPDESVIQKVPPPQVTMKPERESVIHRVPPNTVQPKATPFIKKSTTPLPILNQKMEPSEEDEGVILQRTVAEDTLKAVVTPLDPEAALSARCQEDIQRYMRNLENRTMWAVKMFDASAKLPVGLLAGSTYQMGHFDECLEVGTEEWPTTVVPLPAPVQAQYCLATLTVTPNEGVTRRTNFTSREHAFSLQYDPRDSAWEKLRIPIDPSKKRRDVLYYAVCIPASCGPQDVKKGLEASLGPVVGHLSAKLEVQVQPELCQTAEREPLDAPDIFILVLIVVMFLVIAGCSAFDMLVHRRRPPLENIPKLQQVALSFSAYSNLEKLNKPDSSDEMGILHGLRLFSMIFIILGHRCLFTYGGPFFNPEFLEDRYRHIEDMFLLNGTLLVDTFFVLSGFLTCFGILLELHKRKTLSLGQLYLYRWMRLTPVYMMVVAFYATLLSKVDRGPIWQARVGLEKERCVENWWTNLLYINNYVNSDNLCMFQSWYIACDMHYFLIAPLLVIPLYRRPPLGMALLAGALVITIAVPFAVTFAGDHSGVLRVYMNLLEDPTSREDYYGIYIKSHNRAGPYFIGMAAAYVYGILRINGTKFSTKWMWIFSMVATVFGLSSLFGAWVFYIPGREYFAFENAVYASLHRIGWALTVSWVVLGGCTTRFSVLQPILQLRAFLPLSRLCYCAFLTHGAVQLYTLATLRQPEFMSFPKLFWMASGDVTMSFIFALFVYIFFEAPLGGIQKMIMRGQRKPTTQNERGGVNQSPPQQNQDLPQQVASTSNQDDIKDEPVAGSSQHQV